MGLDMYLKKGIRIPKKKGSKEFKSYDELRKINDLIANEENEEIIELYKDYVFDFGDYLHWKSLTKEVVYWRKANAIHQWFVDNVQDGNDDCGYYEVSKEKLTELRDKCAEVMSVIELEDGKVSNGYSFKENENGEFEKVEYWEDGKIVKNPSVVAQILPTQSGFFYGSTDYNQWYYEDIKRTLAELNKVLKETDFEKEYLEYTSSW